VEIRNPELLADAVRYAVTTRLISPSKIQRKVRVGFATAARLTIELRELGAISEPQLPGGYCRVLAGPDDLDRILAAINDRQPAAREPEGGAMETGF
jgi:DNA segregation ATPase FtsK/SpoIIIE-like protein